ncbi:DMT family transporter [Asanoa sp. WMMD1127]|uniref:DMT family transporter n=1 Tax=Asanoa sp. WMMD1127 TaxID=3016107 RepID=UPI002417E01A|nr:DMT family transporter [Asanoa sp. WMMD1127]MDG4822409.1 DMT family transporter [Asanoa sp. WMMD1127]
MHSNSTLPVGRGILYVLVAAVAWGTGGAVATILYDTSGMGPIAVSFWRFAIAVPLLGAVHLARRRARWTPRPGLRQVVITGVGLAVYQTAYFASVSYAGLAVATVVTLGAGPILIAVGARLTTGEQLGRGGLVTTGLALAGLVLLVGGGGASTGSAPTLGLACALLSATGYATITLLNRGARQATPSTTLGAFAVGLLCLLPLALLEGALPTAGNPAEVYLSLAYLGAVPTALAYALFFAGLSVVRANTAAVLALAEPVAAAVIAVLWLDERLTPAATAGSLLLAAAVVALTLIEGRATRPVGPALSRST